MLGRDGLGGIKLGKPGKAAVGPLGPETTGVAGLAGRADIVGMNPGVPDIVEPTLEMEIIVGAPPSRGSEKGTPTDILKAV